MRTRVTAILVAQRGGAWLEETLTSLAEQRHRPDAIVGVDNGAARGVPEQLSEGGANRIIGLENRLPFGKAVAAAIRSLPEPEGDPASEWIWLLSEDSCPEPGALELILRSVQQAPSVVVAGPKLVDWDRPDHVVELGQGLTRFGSRWLLRRQELDQQQYDHLQDVLGVGPAGMLVRRDVWDELGGFDPGLPVYDDALDFCVRARLAGYRVEVAPESRVRFAQSGVAGPRIDRGRKVMRAAHRQARVSQLHRRISYAPPVVTFFEWLGLPIYAILRVLWALIREHPGRMPGEFTATFSVFFRVGTLVEARRRIRLHRSAGWAALRSLRVDRKTVRTALMIDREAILAATGRRRREVHFISTGGLAVFIAAAVASVVLTWWAIPRTSLFGGGLAPLSSLDQLWWNTRALDGVPADPFTWVLAVLGTITFWNPSHAVVLFTVAAIPLTALGAWMWGAQLTESKAGRALIGLGFALSPVLLDSIVAGRLPTLVLTVTLPWLLLAGSRCRESWSWAGAASLLSAVALACAPVLIPAAIVALLVGAFSSLRGVARVLSTAIVPVALFAPKFVTSILAGRPLDLLMDPGTVLPYEPGSLWHMLLGFPEFGLEGWAAIFDGLGLGGPPATLLVGICMAIPALLALLGLFTGKVWPTLLCALVGGLGMFSALAASQLHLTTLGSTSVAVWTGSGLAVYWLAVLGLAAIGTTAVSRAAAPIVSLALVLVVVAVLPLAARLVTSDVPYAQGEQQMPALVEAGGERDAGMRTLVIEATGEHAVHVRLVEGSGDTLDGIRTSENVPGATAEDRLIADLTGGLAGAGGPSMVEALHEARVSYVLLARGGDRAERSELQLIFDQQDAIASAGHTDQGLLWKVTGDDIAEVGDGDATETLSGTEITGTTIWVVQLVLVLAVVLLALPTGEVTARPDRRKRPKRRKAAHDPEPAVEPAAAVAVEPADSAVEPGDDVAEPADAADETVDAADGPEETAAGPAGAAVEPVEEAAEPADTEDEPEETAAGPARAAVEPAGEAEDAGGETSDERGDEDVAK